MEWLNLKEFGKIYRMSAYSVRKLIENGLVAEQDYIHNGKLWRVRKDANIKNKVVIKLPPYDDYLKSLEAI